MFNVSVFILNDHQGNLEIWWILQWIRHTPISVGEIKREKKKVLILHDKINIINNNTFNLPFK